MKEIGKKIKEVRKRKGLSQEELADCAKISLRTVQRIENNKSQPHGKTLHLICDVLEINAEDLLDYGKKEDKTYLVIFHLSVLAFLAIPLGNIILPVILWLNKKNEVIGLKSIGANLLNFQIVWSVIFFANIFVFTFLKIMHYGYSQYIFLVFIGLYLINIALPIVFAVKSNKGKTDDLYPNIIRLIK